MPILRRFIDNPGALALDPARARLDAKVHELQAQAQRLHDHFRARPAAQATPSSLFRDDHLQIGLDLLNPRTSAERLIEITRRDGLSELQIEALALHPNFTLANGTYLLLKRLSPEALVKLVCNPHANTELLNDLVCRSANIARLAARHPNAQDHTLAIAMMKSSTAQERQEIYAHPNVGEQTLYYAIPRVDSSEELAQIREHRAVTNTVLRHMYNAVRDDDDLLAILAHPLTPSDVLYKKASQNPSAAMKLAIVNNPSFGVSEFWETERLLDEFAKSSSNEPEVLKAIRKHPCTTDATLRYLIEEVYQDRPLFARECRAIFGLLRCSNE